MLRWVVLYTSLVLAANAAAAGPVDWQAARAAGLSRLVDKVQPVPDIEFSDVDGGTHRLADYKGKALLVNFWATWCAPCRAEMPSLQALQDSRGGEDFQVLTIASGRNPPPAIDKFFAEAGVRSLPRLTDASMTLARGMGVLGMPMSVLIDANGYEVARMMGDADWNGAAAQAVIDQLRAR